MAAMPIYRCTLRSPTSWEVRHLVSLSLAIRAGVCADIVAAVVIAAAAVPPAAVAQAQRVMQAPQSVRATALVPAQHDDEEE